jgi:hypothetical protein
VVLRLSHRISNPRSSLGIRDDGGLPAPPDKHTIKNGVQRTRKGRRQPGSTEGTDEMFLISPVAPGR